MADKPTDSVKSTSIEQGTEFKGTMTSTCPVVVNGRVEGKLTAPQLEITQSGSVTGDIEAKKLISRGSLSGNIDAGDLILSGKVGSKTVIKAKNLEVKLAPESGRMEVTFGECTLDVGDEPTLERKDEKELSAEAKSSPSAAPKAPEAVPPPQLINGAGPVAGANKAGADSKAASDSKAAGDGKAAGDSKGGPLAKSSAGGSKPPPAEAKKDSIPPSP